MQDTGKNALDLLGRLVAFDTVSSRSNLDLIAYVSEVLALSGIQAEIMTDRSGGKANLVATIGPRVPGGLMLAGHTDVVPTDGGEWSSDPFSADIRGDRVYGRGTADMKGFIAVVLSLVPEIAAMALDFPVHIALTYDEEIGCFGAAELAPVLAGMTAKPGFCIVGEPTGMAIVNGHKGKLSLDCRIRGHQAHSAHNDRGVNAVEIGAELVARLRAVQRRVAYDGPRDARFDPPYTTIHTGLMTGGTARNIVPHDCRFEAEIRNLPGQDPGALLAELEDFARGLEPEMQKISSTSGIDIDVQSDIPSLAPSETGELLRMALAESRANGPDVVSFATEAGLYQKAGMEVIVCGPGDIRDAHRPDEFVTIDQLARCRTFLLGLVRAFQGRARDRSRYNRP